MKKTIIAIGGGEIKTKQTLDIDRFVVDYVKQRIPADKRPYGLFLGTASHDSMPYFNSYRKTYTSVLDVKADCALSVYGEMDFEHIREKFFKADFLYVGGGDTKYLMEKWRESSIYDLVADAYDRGVVIVGLSAGAICWFKDIYSDYDIIGGQSGEYKLLKGFGWIDDLACPHYDDRHEFDQTFLNSEQTSAYGLENNAALVFEDFVPVKTVSAGGNVYRLVKENGKLVKTVLKL